VFVLLALILLSLKSCTFQRKLGFYQLLLDVFNVLSLYFIHILLYFNFFWRNKYIYIFKTGNMSRQFNSRGYRGYNNRRRGASYRNNPRPYWNDNNNTNRNNNEMDLLERLEKLDRKLDNLERGRQMEKPKQQRRGRNRSSSATSLASTSGGPRSNDDGSHQRSSNPDFSRLAKLLFQAGVLEKAKKKWASTPDDLFKSINNLIRGIRPPSCEDKLLQKDLRLVGRTLAQSITERVALHIDHKYREVKHEISELDTTDLEDAKKVAATYMNKRLGKRSTDPEALEFFDELGESLLDFEPDLIPDTAPAVPSKLCNKRQPEVSPATLRANLDSYAQLSCMPIVNFVFSEDTEPMEEAEQPTCMELSKAKRHKTSTQATNNNKVQPYTLHQGTKDDWRITRSSPNNAVLIGDSNLRLANPFPGLDVNCMPGANLSHVARAISSWRPADKDDRLHVIIQAGINHRDQDQPTIDKFVQDLHQVKTNTSAHVKLYAVGVSTPTWLPKEQTDNILFLNNRMYDLVGEQNFIDALEPELVNIQPNDSSGIHHDAATVAAIMYQIRSTLYPTSLF
jgi:hypothetical protein